MKPSRTAYSYMPSKTISPKVFLGVLLVSFLMQINEGICFAKDLVQARKLLLTGKLEEAKDEYQELLKDPKSAHAATIGLSKISEAQGDLNASLKIVSDFKNPSADVLGRKAEIQFLMGLWNDAEASAANALLQSPDHLQARWVKAQILWAGGDIPKALSEFQWFVKSYSDKLETPNAYKKPEDLLIIAQASLENARWYALGDELETILNDLLKDTLKIDPDFWPAEALAGKILLEKHNRPEALAAFSKVLAINPEAPEALVGKGEAAIQKMEYQEAESFAQRALKSHPNNPDALILLSEISLAESNSTKAREQLALARKARPRDEKILGRLAALAWLDGKTAELQNLEKEALSFDKKPALFYLEMGELLSSRRRFPEAELRLKQAIELRPNLPEPLISLAMLSLQMGREAEARTLLEKGLKADPFHVQTANSLKVLRHLDKYETLKTEHFIFKFDASQDKALVTYMSFFMEEIFAQLNARFRFSPKEPILVEVFSNHEMFSGRTVGVPDLHTIGACTGKVITMVSPQSKTMNKPFNWARVMRHELTHIFNLEQSQFMVPHWLTEGLAVSLEGYPRSDSWNKELKQRIQSNNLYNLSNINLGFQRPRSPIDWQMAYCQSLLYVEYLQKTHGDEASRNMLESFAKGNGTDLALEQVTKSNTANFEKGYLAYIKEITAKTLISDKPKLRNVEELRKAIEADATDAEAQGELALLLINRDRAEARKLAEAALSNKPGQPRASLVLAKLAKLAGDTKKEQALLEDSVKINPDADILFLLGRIFYDAGEFPKATETLQSGMALDPDNPRWLEQLARVFAQTDNKPMQIEVLQKLSRLDPDDLEKRKRLLKLLLQNNQKTEALIAAREVLEIDVSFKEAQDLLLEHLQALGKNDELLKLKQAFNPSR